MRVKGILLALLHVIITLNHSPIFQSNFNVSKVAESPYSHIRQEQALQLPIVVTNPGEYKANRPLFQKYVLQKYQLYDTNYMPNLSQISRLDEQLAFNMEPPSGVFEEGGKIVIQSYRLLETKEFKVTLVNPSEKFRFCVEEIFIDSEEITRQEKRALPFCINGSTKYPFLFSLYITEHKPLIFKGIVYFMVAVYEGEKLVDEKIWPKEVVVKVTHNHLRVVPLEIRNCDRESSVVMIRNPEKWDLSLVIIYKRKLYQLSGEPIQGDIVVPALKSYKFIIDGKDSRMTIYTKSVAIDVTYPVLYVPVYCIQDLVVDYFNIGVLSDDRSLLSFPVTVSSYSNNTVLIDEISLKSSTETVELKSFNTPKIKPNSRHQMVSQIIIHGSSSHQQRSFIEVTIRYMIEQSTDSQDADHSYSLRQTRTVFHYCEMRSPVSVGMKRFIDVSKQSGKQHETNSVAAVSENSFPIRNNLNLPINLNRVLHDESKFKLLWLQDKRDFIFPNHQRDEFSLQYIGSRDLQISPHRHICLLEFNGNLFVPLEIVVYDRTLQCNYMGEDIKCNNLKAIDFGYFSDSDFKESFKDDGKAQQNGKTSNFSISSNWHETSPSKIKEITIRNWNPESKNVKVGIEQNSIQKYGFNTTVKILGPYPKYEVNIRTQGNILELYLKGNHYIVVQISMTPLPNATSGSLPFRILSPDEHITKPIKFKVENGTIALIPQISRFQSAYTKTIEYLNLVSTYKESYRIKEIKSNVTNLMVYCNDHSEIYGNQWIGMALIYEPFFGEWNLTQKCCGHSYLDQIFEELLIPNKPIAVSVTLTTTTELQTNATVLIDKASPPLIELPYNQQFSIREKFRKDAERVDINLIDDGKSHFSYKLSVNNIFQDTLKANIALFDQELIERLDEYLAYQKKMNDKILTNFCLRNDVKVKHGFTPSLIKNLFFLDTLPLQITVQPLTNTSFYINSPVNSKEQVIQAKYFSEYFIETIHSGSRMCYQFEAQRYIKNLIETGVINWVSEQYRFQTLSAFMRKQFEQLEGRHNLQPRRVKYHLEYQEFYSTNYIDKEHFCKGDRNLNKMTSLFRFCQHINIRMKFNAQVEEKTILKTAQCKDDRRECRWDPKDGRKLRRVFEKQSNKFFLLPSKQKTQIAFDIYSIKNRVPIFYFSPDQDNSNSPRTGQNKRQYLDPLLLSNPSFYIILMNNFTSYQLYHQTIQISKPKLRIKNVIVGGHQIAKDEFENHYFKELREQHVSVRNRVLPIFVEQQDFFSVQNGKIFSHSSETQGQQVTEESRSKEKQLVRELLLKGDNQKLFVSGQRVFELVNQGQADILYTHIGFENSEKTCEYQGITILTGPCLSHINNSASAFNGSQLPTINKIHPKDNYQVTLRFKISVNNLINISKEPISIYFYNGNNFHIKFLLQFKLSSDLTIFEKPTEKQESDKMIMKLWNIILNLIAFVFIVAVILIMKEDDIKQKKKRQNKQNFSKIGGKSQLPYQKSSGKKSRSKTEAYLEWNSMRQLGQVHYNIIQSNYYHNTLGNSLPNKGYQFKPVVTVSEEFLNSMKQVNKKQSQFLNFFNESQESQIMVKNGHDIENISLTINLDEQVDGQEEQEGEEIEENKKNQSVSEESSFDFELGNQKHQSSSEEHFSGDSDFGNKSDSDLPEGQEINVSDEFLNDSNEGFGFGFEKEGSKKEKALPKQEEKKKDEKKDESYYNVFFAQNPLKKGSHPFSWMNEDKKRSRLKW